MSGSVWRSGLRYAMETVKICFLSVDFYMKINCYYSYNISVHFEKEKNRPFQRYTFSVFMSPLYIQ